MRRCHVAQHATGDKHLRRIAHHLRESPVPIASQSSLAPACPPLASPPPAPHSPEDMQGPVEEDALLHPLHPDADSTLHDLENSPPDSAPTTLGELWNGRETDRTVEFCQLPSNNYYELLLGSLERGEDVFHTSLPSTGEELGIEIDDDLSDRNVLEELDDFGIEIPDIHYSKNDKVPPESPTYPWPSMAMFLMDLLFSSPCLRFSEQQKNAVLNWAKELGAHDVPSAGAVKKCQERIKNLVGNPTEKVESSSGTIFYINDVGKAIAKDYANPLTRSSMEDYPIDGKGEMSQVFHAEKMLLGMPAELVAPTVRVDSEIYFVNELLQLSSNDYFIPERYFAARPPETSQMFLNPRMWPGSCARWIGFVVATECVIVSTLAFHRSFDEIRANADEF
ncbi:hypothetical protein BKA93DRAFT_692189, partial [Sparassis latifolia]